MSDERALVLVAGYRDLDRVRRDFEGLTDQVKNKQVGPRGVVPVAQDADGNATVIDTGPPSRTRDILVRPRSHGFRPLRT
jgi:hypothetical protein